MPVKKWVRNVKYETTRIGMMMASVLTSIRRPYVTIKAATDAPLKKLTASHMKFCDQIRNAD